MRRIGRAVVESMADMTFGCFGIVFMFFFLLIVLSLPSIWHDSHVWGFIVFACFICPFINAFLNRK